MPAKRSALVAIALTASPVFAGHNYWSGGSAFSANWSDSLNWRNIDGPGQTEKQDVHFQGASARTSSTVNQDYELNAVYFDSDSLGVNSSFTVNRSGTSRIRVHQGVANFTTKEQTVNVPTIFLTSGSIDNEYNNATGGRIYMGDIGTNGNNVTFYPSANGIFVNGGIYDNGSVTVAGPGTVSPYAQSYWTGGLFLRGGAISYFTNSQLGPNSNPIIFNPDSGKSALLSSYISLTNAHPIEFRSGEGVVAVETNNLSTFSGALSGGGSFVKAGAGTVVLTGANSRTGPTTVREGVLRLSTNVTLPDTALSIAANATLAYGDNANDRVGALSGAGTFNLGSGSVIGVGNPGDASATGSGAGTFSGTIVGANVNLIKQGSGTLNLKNANPISGIVDGLGGRLLANNSSGSATGTATVYVYDRASFGGDGAISGPLDVYPGGTLSPSYIDADTGIGSLTVGNLSFRDGARADFDLASGGGNDSVRATSDLLIQGANSSLNLSLIFNQSITGKRTLIHTDGTRTGVFGKVTGMMMPNGQLLAVTYDAQNVYVTPARAGDATLNGVVNFDDLVVLAQNYNGAAGKIWSNGDFDGTGSVNFDDLVVLAQNYNTGAATIAGVSESFAADWALAQSLVPEPTALLAFGVIGAMVSRRRVH